MPRMTFALLGLLFVIQAFAAPPDDAAAWESFFQGIQMLEEGQPRAKVLDQWRDTLKKHGESRYGEQLKDLIAELKKQVEEDKRIAAQTVADPEKLPLAKRVAYCIARFPDVHGVQSSSPGHCQTVGLGDGTQISDAVVKIGRPAVPALIEQLNDTRLTRSVGFQRNFYRQRIVLRGQDVAVQCIEAITEIRFYHPSSTSSYLSNEGAEVRQRVIDDIKTWWKGNGNRSPLEGFLARLDKGHLWDRLEMLRKIEAIDKNAVDPFGTLKRWALEGDVGALTEIAEELAKRKDGSLLPAMRQLVRDRDRESLDRAVYYLVRYGDAADFAFLLDAARRDAAANPHLGNAKVLAAVAWSVRDSDRPPALPLLVEFLKMGRAFQGTSPEREFEWCMPALIRQLGPENYKSDDPPKERHAAIDRWLAWWDSEGEATFLKKHPHLRDLLVGGEQIRTVVDPNQLPRLIVVESADPRRPITYDVPRAELAALLKSGKIAARQLGDEAIRFRFATEEAAMTWLAGARPIRPQGKLVDDQSLFTRITTFQHGKGPIFGRDGRAWFWYSDSDVSVAEVKCRVEQVFQGKEPAIRGPSILLVDSKDRVWLSPYADSSLLLGYDPHRQTWTEHRCVLRKQLLAGKDEQAIENRMEESAFEDCQGRLYFADHLGVHVLDGKDWSYQPFFARNIRENKFHDPAFRVFDSPRFTQDAEGRVYAWSMWGSCGRSGSLGFWCYDGKRWHNVDAVEKVRTVLPRGPEGVWVLDEDEKLFLLKDGKRTGGEAAKQALCPHLKFEKAWLVARGRDGTAYLALHRAIDRNTLVKMEHRILALPFRGPARELGREASAFFNAVRWDVVCAPDGWLWGTAGHAVQAMSPDGKRFKTLELARRFTYATVLGFDAQGMLYMYGSGHVWKLDPAKDHHAGDLGQALLPAMRVSTVDCTMLDSRGRMWCTWKVAGSPTARFDGKVWKTFPEATGPRYSEPYGFIAAFPGADGAMIFESRGYAFHLFDDQGWVAESSAVDMALKHPERFRKALAYPPPPAQDGYHKLVKDAKGRIWWSAWESELGVVDGAKAISGKGTNLAVHPSAGNVCSFLTPIGDGSKVLAVLNDGKAGILDAQENRIVKVGDAPMPMPSWRTVGPCGLFRDRGGRVWVVQNHQSRPIAATGKPGASVPGCLLMEDRAGGLWFREEKDEKTWLARLGPDGKGARLEVPDLLPSGCIAESPDGSVWALTQLGLLRIRHENNLAVTERYSLRVTWHDSIGCDKAGRVWHAHDHSTQSNSDWQLLYYATGP